MNAHEALAAWKEAQACETPGFYEKFEQLTGINEFSVTSDFQCWGKLSHSTAVAIAERQGLTVHEGGFQAYLAELYWPTGSFPISQLAGD